MKLEDIGFYTLSDERAKHSSITSPLWRCEMILTDMCNFKCPYCRGLSKEIAGTMCFEKAMNVLKIWCDEGLRNVRFSGGEPTLYKGLEELVTYCKKRGVTHIAISTNGSANFEKYEKLAALGVNDFSISLDACCASVGDKMSGGICGSWNRVVDSIRKVSKLTYTTVGIVVNEENIDSCVDTIKFASSLGVADVRIIPSAQFNKLLVALKDIPQDILEKHPILKYRVNNALQGRNVRGISCDDSCKCNLALDDMAVAGDYHYPCIIYMREQGKPIGKISKNVRKERFEWVKRHNAHEDPICKKNCLDVCIDYNGYCERWKS